jgi:hypothetical protein
MCVVVNVLVVNITPIVSCQWIQSHVLLQFQKQRGVFLMDFLASRKSSDLANVGALAQLWRLQKSLRLASFLKTALWPLGA